MMENEPIPNTSETHCPYCGSMEFHLMPPHSITNSPDAAFGGMRVQCSVCDETFVVHTQGEMRPQQEHDELPSASAELNPGDVLRLPIHLGEIPAGLYMVRTVGFLIELARCADNEDGDLASTHRVVKVTHHEIERFEHTYLTIPTTL